MPRRRRHGVQPFDHGDPLSRPNYAFLSAALATIMIGLMIAANYRIQAHAITIDLPVPYLINVQPVRRAEPLVVNDIQVREDGVTLWNGAPVQMAELLSHLHRARFQPVRPGITLSADDRVPYDHVLRVLAILDATDMTGWEFCLKDLARHQRYEQFASPVTIPGPTPAEVCQQAFDLQIAE